MRQMIRLAAGACLPPATFGQYSAAFLRIEGILKQTTDFANRHYSQRQPPGSPHLTLVCGTANNADCYRTQRIARAVLTRYPFPRCGWGGVTLGELMAVSPDYSGGLEALWPNSHERLVLDTVMADAPACPPHLLSMVYCLREKAQKQKAPTKKTKAPGSPARPAKEARTTRASTRAARQ
jgi:hypothetical protein